MESDLDNFREVQNNFKKMCSTSEPAMITKFTKINFRNLIRIIFYIGIRASLLYLNFFTLNVIVLFSISTTLAALTNLKPFYPENGDFAIFEKETKNHDTTNYNYFANTLLFFGILFSFWYYPAIKDYYYNNNEFNLRTIFSL